MRLQPGIVPGYRCVNGKIRGFIRPHLADFAAFVSLSSRVAFCERTAFARPRTRVWACSSVWLERTPDKREVGSSSLPRPTTRAAGAGTLGSERDAREAHTHEAGDAWHDVFDTDLCPARLCPGAIAQLGERLLCKQEVVGSIPSGSTRAPRAPADFSASALAASATHEIEAGFAGRVTSVSRDG
jgi:hypothetical protein